MASDVLETVSPWKRFYRLLLGRPRDFRDPHVFHKMSLIAFMAWIGLGADGLSSSAYGPDECFRGLLEKGDYAFMAVFLAGATALTVFVISYAYSRVIEHFPSGGGGYLVATKLLGKRAGVVSGCALLVDYVLTITTSIASGGDALFSLLPVAWLPAKLPLELAVLGALVVLNLRGVKESVTALMPIFLVFIATHLVLIVGGIVMKGGALGGVLHGVGAGLHRATANPAVGAWGLFLIFLSAYSRGGGTYTGIEAVSNGLQIMREPQVQTGKRTMVYMATSLAFTAGGILFLYLLYDAHPAPGKTMNAVVSEAFAGGTPYVGGLFVGVTLVSESLLLIVAAQTGFIDAPRVMANMAVDSWLPHRFASLSDRLTMKDGVVLIGGASLALLLGTRGSVAVLVIMYSINVFVTFSLSQAGMIRFWVRDRQHHPAWLRHASVHIVGFVLCVSILTVTVIEKFRQGAWLTLVITACVIALCMSIHRHYATLAAKLRALDHEFEDIPSVDHRGSLPDKRANTAVLLVGRYGGVGIHSVLSIQKMFPGYFKNLIFVSIAVVDSGNFKGASEIEHLKDAVHADLERYVELARRLGWNSDCRMSLGLDAVDEVTKICIAVSREFPRAFFFSGKLLWKRESWFQRILHNETARQVQRRLQWKGLPMAILPLRIADAPPKGSVRHAA